MRIYVVPAGRPGVDYELQADGTIEVSCDGDSVAMNGVEAFMDLAKLLAHTLQPIVLGDDAPVQDAPEEDLDEG